MTSLSLKWRISLWISAVLIAVITTISIISYIEFQESHLRNIDRTLNAMANGIASILDVGSNQDKWSEEIGKVTGTSDGNSTTLYRIWMDGSSADILVRGLQNSKHSQWLRELSEENRPLVEESNFMNMGLSGNEYRVVWLRHKINENIMNIVVAGSSHYTYHEMHEFLRLLLILGTSLIIGSFVATIWTVRCGLRPVNMTAERLKDITRPDIGNLIFDDKKVPKELQPFIKALNDMLHRLDKVLKQQKEFTSDAAHELRTPLSLAKSTLQAAQIHQRQPAEYRQAINDTLEDIVRMENLIEQLLVLAHLDEANQDAVDGEVLLDVLLRELTEAYGKKMEPTGGKVIFEESHELTIHGDLDELIRLFSNVLENAVKYGPADGTIRIKLQNENNDYAAIYIHDEGGNIPPEILPRLFDRFYRVEPSRSKSTGGSGLGLAIAREIARRHKGDISITSSPDSGTLVCIRLACT